MTDDLRGHVALVTGATDGIGRLTASRLSARRTTVLVHGRSREQDKGGARVVMVASAAQAEIDFDDLMLTRGYDGKRAYAQSKLALVMATMELADELKSQGVTVNALHPGSLLNTKMVRQGFGSALGPAEAGAEAEERLATAPMLADITGAYFDRMDQAEPEVQARDDEARRRLMGMIDQLAEAA
ncbi:SDR family NAD(P)-dependent oxidoreductase [Halochromatium salexigens]|uniref:SDR family NAD(P)-dependent oxidoreductase n=1 Tax=Halochromatium salexigens TaxID=49447 RepID=A0AAJ0UEF2_HALSE|nr:SDR family NAD(P)-dependent oxidoreductase [Halochromatium salexigens]MBK5929929.1 hypothetical protein [Halochromatium salexigens]